MQTTFCQINVVNIFTGLQVWAILYTFIHCLISVLGAETAQGCLPQVKMVGSGGRQWGSRHQAQHAEGQGAPQTLSCQNQRGV